MEQFSWSIIVLLGGLLVSLIAAAIQIGLLKNQIQINTGRLGKLETFTDNMRDHAANTSARWPDIERRLLRLEGIVNHITIDLKNYNKDKWDK